MKRGLIFLTFCALSAAMVPRERRALNMEDELIGAYSSTTTTTESIKICAPQTPCGWSTYRPNVKIIELNITNSYCVCGPGTLCLIYEDDSSVSAFIHRCRPPGDADETSNENAES